jgi:hypothetical protein
MTETNCDGKLINTFCFPLNICTKHPDITTYMIVLSCDLYGAKIFSTSSS